MALKLSPVEAAAAVELAERHRMAIRIFRPMPHQDEFFKQPRAKYTACQGGNRCTTSDSEVVMFDESGQQHVVQIKDVNVGDKILGVYQGSKKIRTGPTEVLSKQVFTEEAIRVTTKRGYVLDCTQDHPIMCCPPLPPGYNNGVAADYKKAQWRDAKDIPVGWYIRIAYGPYARWRGEIDEDAYIHGLIDGDGSCECYGYGVMKLAGHRDESLIPWMSQKLTAAGIHNRTYKKKNSLCVSLEWCNKAYKQKHMEWKPKWTAPVMAGYIRGLMDTDGCVSTEGKIIFVQKDEEIAKRMHRHLLMFGIRSSLYLIPANLKNRRPNPIWRLVVAGINAKKFHAAIGLGESGKAERLRLYVGQPTKHSINKRLEWEPVRSVENVGPKEFTGIATSSETYVSNGIISHNSGKSTCAGVLFAAVATDTPITLSDGTVVEARMPWQKGRCLRMYVVAFDESAIGRTIHRILFKSGLFKVVIDPVTKELRSYDPDKDVNLKPKDSPPLIPRRFIKKIVWNKAGENIFSKVIIQNPATGEELAEIFAFSSRGEPQPGDPVDEIWIDERCYMDNYVDEAKARLVDRDGRLTWSSWPDEDSEDLKKYIDMLDKNILEGNHHIARKVILTMSGNKHLGRKAIAEFLAGCNSPEEAMARDRGLFTSVSLRVYPLFDRDVHTAIIYDQEIEDALSRELRKTDGIPPNTWTKYLSLDPGTDHPAVLLCAVPPLEFGDYLVAYQEFYPGRADAIQLAQMIKREMPNEKYYRFIIDWKAAGQQPPGFETRIVDAYQKAFLAAGLSCHLTKHLFSKGSPDVGGRQLILGAMMHPTKTGLPKFRVVTHRCPKLCDQLTKVKKHKIQKEVVDERKAPGQQHDLVDTCEYTASARPTYVYLRPTLEESSPAFQRYMKKFGQQKERESISIGTFY